MSSRQARRKGQGLVYTVSAVVILATATVLLRNNIGHNYGAKSISRLISTSETAPSFIRGAGEKVVESMTSLIVINDSCTDPQTRFECCTDPNYPVLNGVDPVELRRSGQTKLGNPQLATTVVTLQGTYSFWFSTFSNKRFFDSHSEWYIPSYGGFDIQQFCSDASLDYRGLAAETIDLTTSSVIDGRLMVFASESNKQSQITYELDLATCSYKYAEQLGVGDMVYLNSRCYNTPDPFNPHAVQPPVVNQPEKNIDVPFPTEMKTETVPIISPDIQIPQELLPTHETVGDESGKVDFGIPEPFPVESPSVEPEVEVAPVVSPEEPLEADSYSIQPNLPDEANFVAPLAPQIPAIEPPVTTSEVLQPSNDETQTQMQPSQDQTFNEYTPSIEVEIPSEVEITSEVEIPSKVEIPSSLPPAVSETHEVAPADLLVQKMLSEQLEHPVDPAVVQTPIVKHEFSDNVNIFGKLKSTDSQHSESEVSNQAPKIEAEVLELENELVDSQVEIEQTLEEPEPTNILNSELLTSEVTDKSSQQKTNAFLKPGAMTVEQLEKAEAEALMNDIINSKPPPTESSEANSSSETNIVSEESSSSEATTEEKTVNDSPIDVDAEDSALGADTNTEDTTSPEANLMDEINELSKVVEELEDEVKSLSQPADEEPSTNVNNESASSAPALPTLPAGSAPAFPPGLPSLPTLPALPPLPPASSASPPVPPGMSGFPSSASSLPFSLPQTAPALPPALPPVSMPALPPAGMPALPSGGMPPLPAGSMPPLPSGGMPPLPSGSIPLLPSGSMPVPPLGGVPALPPGVPALPTGGIPALPPGGIPALPALPSGNMPSLPTGGNPALPPALPPLPTGSAPSLPTGGMPALPPAASPPLPPASSALETESEKHFEWPLETGNMEALPESTQTEAVKDENAVHFMQEFPEVSVEIPEELAKEESSEASIVSVSGVDQEMVDSPKMDKETSPISSMNSGVKVSDDEKDALSRLFAEAEQPEKKVFKVGFDEKKEMGDLFKSLMDGSP